MEPTVEPTAEPMVEAMADTLVDTLVDTLADPLVDTLVDTLADPEPVDLEAGLEPDFLDKEINTLAETLADTLLVPWVQEEEDLYPVFDPPSAHPNEHLEMFSTITNNRATPAVFSPITSSWTLAQAPPILPTYQEASRQQQPTTTCFSFQTLTTSILVLMTAIIGLLTMHSTLIGRRSHTHMDTDTHTDTVSETSITQILEELLKIIRENEETDPQLAFIQGKNS